MALRKLFTGSRISIAAIVAGSLAAASAGSGCGKREAGGSDVIGDVPGVVFAKRANFDKAGKPMVGNGTDQVIDARHKHRVFAFGPDVTLPVASKSKLFALVNIRYLWETGARVKTQGDTLAITATFPLPSVKLQ